MEFKRSESIAILQELTAAIDHSPNARLHSELSAFDAAAASGNGPGTLNESNAMLQTCKQLGFGNQAGA
jgi:hypothetical protein